MEEPEGQLQPKESESYYKLRFATALLKEPDGDSFKAALSVFDDALVALRVHVKWAHDPEVQHFTRDLLEKHGEEEFLPTKREFLNRVWHRMNSSYDDGDFAKIADIYAKARGFYPKDQPAQASLNVIYRSMIVPDNGSVEEWEASALDQQRALTAEAREV